MSASPALAAVMWNQIGTLRPVFAKSRLKFPHQYLRTVKRTKSIVSLCERDIMKDLSERKTKKTPMSQAYRDENLTILVAYSIARNDFGSVTASSSYSWGRNISGETAFRGALSLLANHAVNSDFNSRDNTNKNDILINSSKRCD